MRGTIAVTLALLSFTVSAGQAQRLSPRPSERPAGPGPSLAKSAIHVPTAPSPSPTLLVLGGIAGGAVGVFTGAIVGGRLTEHDCEDCGLVGAADGAVAGGSALLPLGVHLANRGRGNLGRSLLASLAVGAIGWGATLATNKGELMLAVPVLQVATSVIIERATSR